MVTAVVLMKVARSHINDIAQQLSEVQGITEVYSVAGRYDLVALIRVPNNDALAELVTGRLVGLDSIEETETLIAFRSYSRHDLESMFALGMET